MAAPSLDNDEKVLLCVFFACGDLEVGDDLGRPISQTKARKIFEDIFLLDHNSIIARFSNTLKRRPEWLEVARLSSDRRKNNLLIKPEGYKILHDQLLRSYWWEVIKNFYEKSGDSMVRIGIMSKLKKIEEQKINMFKKVVFKERKDLLIDILQFFPSIINDAINELGIDHNG